MQAKKPLECDFRSGLCFSDTWHLMSSIVISESPWMIELSYWKSVIRGRESRAWMKLVEVYQVGTTLLKAHSIFFCLYPVYWKYIKPMYFSLSFCFDNSIFVLLRSKYLKNFQHDFFCILWIVWGCVSEFSIAWIFNIYFLCLTSDLIIAWSENMSSIYRFSEYVETGFVT